MTSQRDDEEIDRIDLLFCRRGAAGCSNRPMRLPRLRSLLIFDGLQHLAQTGEFTVSFGARAALDDEVMA